MNKIIAGFAGIVLAVSLTACSSGDEEPTVVTQTVTAAPEPAPETSTAPSEPVIVSDAEFAQIIRENTSEFRNDTDADIAELGRLVCAKLDEGFSIEEVLEVLNGVVSPESSGFFVGASVGAYCDAEHGDAVEDFIATYGGNNA